MHGQLQALTERLASLNERCKQELSHEDALNVHAAFEAANLELDKKMEEQRVYQKDKWVAFKMEECIAPCKAKLLSVIHSKGKSLVVARKQGGVWVKCRCKIHAVPEITDQELPGKTLEELKALTWEVRWYSEPVGTKRGQLLSSIEKISGENFTHFYEEKALEKALVHTHGGVPI